MAMVAGVEVAREVAGEAGIAPYLIETWPMEAGQCTAGIAMGVKALE
jgi:hypothetical protein